MIKNVGSHSLSKFNLQVIYLLFTMFLLGELLFLAFGNNVSFIYVINLISTFFLSFILFSNENIYSKWKYGKQILILFIVGAFALLGVLFSKDFRLTLLILKFFLLYNLFSQYEISQKHFLKFLNNTFLAYVIVSAIFFYIFPNTLYFIDYDPHFTTDLYFVKYPIFRGVQGGTPASIDSYSAVIFIVNLFNRKDNPSRRKFLLLSAFCVLLSLRMTPLVALVFSMLLFPLIRRPWQSVLFILSGMIVFLFFLVLLFKNPKILGVDFFTLAYLATHARSMIWLQQLEILFKEYSFIDYLFGSFSTEKFSVQALQITGGEIEQDGIGNPHNNYLLLFYQMPVPFIIAYLTFVSKLYFHFDRNWFVAVFLISIACFTNSTIISLHNPIYIMILCYYLTKKKTVLETK